MGTTLLVGLDEPETAELRRRLDRRVLAFENLPRIRVDLGRLLVEHPHAMGHFETGVLVKAEKKPEPVREQPKPPRRFGDILE